MKTSLIVLCLFCNVVSYAEIISSISFNPSRMGEYTYLKVSDKATLRGGLNATTLNISSGGTVSVTPDNSTRIYDVPTVSGESGSSIDMSSTAFHGNTANVYSGYQSSGTGVPSGLLPNVKAQGGDLKFTQDSYISTLYAVDRLRQKVGGLIGTSFEITGNGGSAINLYESSATKGFFLAGNDIPEPVGAHTNTSSNLTGCLLAWEKRKTSDSPAKEVWLLGLQGCNGAVTPPPSGGCSSSSPATDSNCWNFDWEYVQGSASSHPQECDPPREDSCGTCNASYEGDSCNYHECNSGGSLWATYVCTKYKKGW